MNFTEAELKEIREYKNAQSRKWWAKQSPEERRQRRQRYLMNTIRRKKAAEAADAVGDE